MKYRVTFNGRRVGAIGIFEWFTLEVEAANEDAARLKIYDTHEHLTGVHIVPIGDPPLMVCACHPETHREQIYLVHRAYLRNAADRNRTCCRWGLLVATRVNGVWLNLLGEKYGGGTDLDACPWVGDLTPRDLEETVSP